MKLTTSLISAVALNVAAAVVRETRSTCNVEGNLFVLEAYAYLPALNETLVDEVLLAPWSGPGIDTVAVLGSADPTAVFYINKENNHLIVLDSHNQMTPANAYTDSPEGGELRFTSYNDTSQPYYWPSFNVNEQGHLTANGKADIFTYCGSNYTVVFEGTLAIGHVAGKNCKAVDYVDVSYLTSTLSND